MQKLFLYIFIFGNTFFAPVIATNITESSDYRVQAATEDLKYENVKVGKSHANSSRCFIWTNKIQNFIEKEDWSKSIEMLEYIEADAKLCESTYKYTKLRNIKGYVYYSLGNFPDAIRNYKQVIESKATPKDLRIDTRFIVAQLLIAEKRYEEAAEQLEINILESAEIVNQGYIELLSKVYEMLLTNGKSKFELDIAIDKPETSELLTATPIFVPQPHYPRRAMARGVEGYAVVEFVVTTSGDVRDPVIIDEYPEDWGFDRSALFAAKGIKFQPFILDGFAKEIPGVKYKFTFKMAW